MIFKSKTSPDTMVWDAENKKILCQFKEGMFATDDKRVILILVGLGYEHDEEVQDVVVETKVEEDGLENTHIATLKKMARDKGLEVPKSITKDEVIELLRG